MFVPSTKLIQGWPDAMRAFTTLSGAAAPLLRANIDTDIIIRIERLTTLKGDALGPFALEALRFKADGSEDPDFVLNQSAFRAAPILLAGANFGCGSSREGAVTALLGRGIRCVIAPSFGDIFFNNCFQNGLLPIRLSEAQTQALALDAAGGAPLTVDLMTQKITTQAGTVVVFKTDPLRREGLLRGVDDIGLTLQDDALIRAWQQKDRANRPWVWADARGGAGAGRLAGVFQRTAA
jgi:3-isopropylmalate/(R)-2-methylmalate dehydratase small subunit